MSPLPTMDLITNVVADDFGLTVQTLRRSRRRNRDILRPRQIAMHLCSTEAAKSLPQVGRYFRRDHTTVLHSTNVIAKLRLEDPDFADHVERLRRRVLDRASYVDNAVEAVDEALGGLSISLKAAARTRPLAVLEALSKALEPTGPS